MLKIDRNEQRLSRLTADSLAGADLTERYDLQEFISNSPDEFFGELGQKLFLIGKEVLPSQTVQDRIDLLAVDQDGNAVIVELKRGSHKLQMMQAISYAAMISQWEPQQFVDLLNGEQREALQDFVDGPLENLNGRQRIVLVAEGFDYALLASAEWLTERYGVNISCCRIALAADPQTGAEYLECSVVYPTPGLTEEAISRGRRRSEVTTGKWSSWDEALGSVNNAAMVSFFRSELDSGREPYLLKRTLMYRVNGKRRWFIAARTKNAYVWQYGRFEGDEEFWRQRLSDPGVVKPVKRDECLRLFLATEQDFTAFGEAFASPLQKVEWLDSQNYSDLDPSDGDE